MREKDLPIDRTKHKLYTRSAKKCVQKLLRRCYDEKTAAALWEKVQLQYCEFLRDEPALAGVKLTTSIYDPILIFAWYAAVPDKPPAEVIQKDIYESVFGPLGAMGKLFNMNQKSLNRLVAGMILKANENRVEEIKRFPDSFRVGECTYDEENGVIRYSFTQCPNAEFARRHHMENVLPFLCNCDHLAMRAIHAALIREGTCAVSDRCDYCIVGDRHPLAAEYELTQTENGLWLSEKKE